MAILKKDILELIDQKLVRARSSWEEYHKLAPNSYWTWVEWGEIQILEQLKEDIEELEDIG